MKKICIFFLLGLTFFSCNKENIDCSKQSVITSISGTIDNWNLGSNYKIKMCQYNMPSEDYVTLDSSNIDIDGNFNINLLSIPTLGNINWGNAVQISNSSAKISIGQLYLKVFSQSGVIVGSLVYGKFASINSGRNAGDFGIGYFYVDQDVEINSTGINLDFGKGWNKSIQKYTTSTNSTISVDFSDINEAKWIFH